MEHIGSKLFTLGLILFIIGLIASGLTVVAKFFITGMIFICIGSFVEAFD